MTSPISRSDPLYQDGADFLALAGLDFFDCVDALPIRIEGEHEMHL